jgi:hypothetical protein
MQPANDQAAFSNRSATALVMSASFRSKSRGWKAGPGGIPPVWQLGSRMRDGAVDRARTLT